MERVSHAIHGALVDAAQPADGSVLVDLGAGGGATLAAMQETCPLVLGIGLDIGFGKLVEATQHCAHVPVVLADLEQPLPLKDETVDVTISHNTLEYLGQPKSLLEEAARILRPGGRAVWSHIDFAGILLNTSDHDLNHRVLDTYATLVPPWMNHADGRVGRKIPGLVRRTGLHLESVEVYVSVATDLAGDARRRIDQILEVLRPAIQRRDISLSNEDLDSWQADLSEKAVRGDFFFAEPLLLTVTTKPELPRA